MFFLIQKDDKYNDLDVDLLTLKQELNKQKFQHEYTYLSLKEMGLPINKINMKDVIPVGSLEFVSKYLKSFHNIENMNPIEVPNILRTDEFLCRDYEILTKKELLNKRGYAFVKGVSKLKDFSYTGDISLLMYEDDGKEPFLKDNNLYLYSEFKNILSEYRVFVIEDKVKGIQFYDGNPLIMPNENEIKKLQKAINMYILDNDRPKAYTLDVAIFSEKDKRDLMILECHPFCSVGLYGLVGSFLPYAYRYGLDYYIEKNKELKTWIKE